jgi:hypothetical protein
MLKEKNRQIDKLENSLEKQHDGGCEGRLTTS